jgi:hypothetical protein
MTITTVSATEVRVKFPSQGVEVTLTPCPATHVDTLIRVQPLLDETKDDIVDMKSGDALREAAMSGHGSGDAQQQLLQQQYEQQNESPSGGVPRHDVPISDHDGQSQTPSEKRRGKGEKRKKGERKQRAAVTVTNKPVKKSRCSSLRSLCAVSGQASIIARRYHIVCWI